MKIEGKSIETPEWQGWEFRALSGDPDAQLVSLIAQAVAAIPEANAYAAASWFMSRHCADIGDLTKP